MRWLVWLFGVMLSWLLYDVTSTLVARRTDDPWLPMLVGLGVAIVVGGVAVWVVKRRMPGTR
ncbi:MAG: hypothetical protein AABY18_07050 [Candidatus Thermoplasmatota archaeon]